MAIISITTMMLYDENNVRGDRAKLNRLLYCCHYYCYYYCYSIYLFNRFLFILLLLLILLLFFIYYYYYLLLLAGRNKWMNEWMTKIQDEETKQKKQKQKNKKNANKKYSGKLRLNHITIQHLVSPPAAAHSLSWGKQNGSSAFLMCATIFSLASCGLMAFFSRSSSLPSRSRSSRSFCSVLSDIITLVFLRLRDYWCDRLIA